ncbi:S-adenosyl-L-methionine dependent methyltransferase [Trametes versicolor FP-101664 SS1]|uniref:S-adenosyl-L-methionine dependent methyltransferase n=1 Tax=Trametes versicolor (strain FP-101664) TaxID=717944 RepID=UPI000462331F|nr:S-adenosyl-L-methionine dependent methyltransferase [Trametes versicolor FP-101664 SS1]EIW52173.1 S-adenosyl-L-methionine dependent methyltransferase [Trametes versicolor FP-101664 SS1]
MHPSASVYTNLALRLYDLVVLIISNTFAWRCPTRATQLPFYQKHIGEHAHLEIGVGTGYYPAASAARLSKLKRVTLLDLNANTLGFAQHRLVRAGYKGEVGAVEQSVFDALPQDLHAQYDSIALFYLFHCLPGSFPTKAKEVFARVVPALAPGGVVYGTTILGKDVRHNWFGGKLMGLYNGKGIFGNAGDSEEGLREALRDAFEEHDLRVEGVVALFSARKPRNARI